MTPATLTATRSCSSKMSSSEPSKIGPEMRAGQGVDQLPGDAHLPSRFAHRAFQHIADAELTPDLFHVNGAPLVGKGRIAGDDEEPADAGKGGDDLLDHPVDEIFLLRVAAHIGEGQHRDRRLVWQRQGGRRSCRRLGPRYRASAVDAQRPGDVFEALLADIGKLGLDLAPHLAKSVFGDADAARLGQAFEPCRDVDAIAKEIVAVEDHVAEIDPDAELDAAVGRIDGVAFRHRLLHRNGTAHRVDDAAELSPSVASGLDDAALMLATPGSINSLRCAFSRASVPSSSSPISRL
jgi:hypothetical protein